MVTTICERVCKMLGRRGLLGEANHDSHEADTTPEALLACRKVALSRGRFEPLGEPWMRRKKDGRWAADFKGFSLHAGVSFSPLECKGRERLVRYCTRPPRLLAPGSSWRRQIVPAPRRLMRSPRSPPRRSWSLRMPSLPKLSLRKMSPCNLPNPGRAHERVRRVFRGPS
jgi:hypothetical protein